MREIKFRAWDGLNNIMNYNSNEFILALSGRIGCIVDDSEDNPPWEGTIIFYEDDIKQFIKDLKKLLIDGSYYGDRSFTDLFKRIDKLAGEDRAKFILKRKINERAGEKLI